MQKLDKFKTDVGLVFGFLQNAENKEALLKYVSDHHNEFQHIKEEAYNVISELTNSKEFSKIKENIAKGDEVDMCEGIRGMIEDGKMEGKIELLTEKVSKKLAKGYSAEEIAEMLEEDVDDIEKMIDEIKKTK